MGKRVMVVDDEATVGDMLGLMLEALGHEARVFSSPLASLAWLATEAPDIAFLDLRMSEMDGVTLLERIRAGGHQFPVVAITGFAADEMVVAVREGGALAVAAKPVSMDTLDGLVHLGCPSHPVC